MCMKIANKILFAFCLLVFFGSVFADGMIVDPDFYPIRQRSQEAFVNYENGKENLFIMVDLRDAVASGEKTVWIFSVPANPETIEINNLKGFPVLAGKEIKQQAAENVFFLEAYMAAAAFPPFAILPLLLMMSAGSPASYDGMGRVSSEQGISVPGLVIYQHIDKYGIATEVIKAQDVEIFKRFLAARGTNLSNEAEQFLSEYMGKDYSFIVSWISDRGAIVNADSEVGGYGYGSDYYYPYYNNPIGVFIKFPSQQIFYPLKPTAYYGNDTFPVVLNIAGFKDVDVFSNIKDGTTVGHYYQKFFSRTIQEEETMKAVFNGSLPDSLNYTRVSINKSANYFTQDLWIPANESVAANALNLVNQTWLFWMLAIFFAFAFLAVLLANRALGLKLNYIDMIIIAIANFFSCFVAALAIGLMKKEKFVSRAKEDAFAKKVVSLLVFEALFLCFAIALFVLTILGMVFFS